VHWFLVLTSCTGCPGFGASPPEMQRENLETAVFASESTVTYRDGKTPIGVFFDQEHRRAVGWDELPPGWVVSIVASEDGNFWSHLGVDPQHIARAARDDLEAGSVVSGGSTITQQTAKNLFDRPDRTLGSKFEELDQALQLEKLYTKREILTFYANLFYVTGNGLGIGIAARYFFDEDPKDLTLLESAFIAGMVKGPSNYDPFLGDEKRQEEARKRAVDRTRYVLQRIVDEPTKNLVPKDGDGKNITADQVEAMKKEAAKLLAEGFELPFRKGTFRFDTSAVLDEVNKRLATPAFAKILADAGVHDPATAGLTVVTTIDQVAQHEATYGLWHQLGDLGVMLEQLDATAFVQEDASPPRADPEHPPTRHEFRTAKITAHTGDHLDADLGGFPCTIDRDAIVRAASSVYRGSVGDRYAKTPTSKVDELAAAIKDGDVVIVSVRETPRGATAICDLEAKPELQGAAIVLEDGQVRAMVGGSTNKDFNRATALRQFGSAFKPLIYHSAMTLGWQPDDVLDNRRNVFPFSGTFYMPDPDHEPHDKVSMTWAGVNSENLASVWLLYHLLDKLSDDELKRVAQDVGLARGSSETPEAYAARIQKLGVLPTKGRLTEAQFLAARTEVVQQLEAEGQADEAFELRTMQYGWGFDKQTGDSSDRKRALQDAWTYLKPLMDRCEAEFDSLDKALSRGGAASAPDLSVLDDGGKIEVACGTRPEGFESPSSALRVDVLSTPPRTAPVSVQQAPARGGKAGKGKAKAHPIEPDPRVEPEPDDRPSGRSRLAPLDEMMVDGRVSHATMKSVEAAMERRKMLAETTGADLYDPDNLYWHPDFRTLLALTYVTHLAARYGVHTDLLEVMSLPLGASEITLEEAARMYEGLTSGQAWVFSDPNATPSDDPGPTTLISEIRDRNGTVLYQAEPTARSIATPAVGEMTADLLRNVVRFGTAKSAKETVKAGSAFVPLGGKTGTTNDFKNVAFVGYLPVAGPDGYSASKGPIVAVYVGYDDNRSMKTGKISVSGAVGALPAWISTVAAIHDPLEAPTGLEAVDGFWPLAHGPDLVERRVTTDVGLPAEGDEEGSTTLILTRLNRIGVEPPPAPPEPKRTPTRARGGGKKWWQWWGG
jgi:membrane peptidoglycan carboxypeptidase